MPPTTLQRGHSLPPPLVHNDNDLFLITIVPAIDCPSDILHARGCPFLLEPPACSTEILSNKLVRRSCFDTCTGTTATVLVRVLVLAVVNVLDTHVDTRTAHARRGRRRCL